MNSMNVKGLASSISPDKKKEPCPPAKRIFKAAEALGKIDSGFSRSLAKPPKAALYEVGTPEQSKRFNSIFLGLLADLQQFDSKN